MLKSYTKDFYRDDNGNDFEVPFTLDNDTAILHIDGNKAILGGLAYDDSPGDPFEVFDEGEFCQFNGSRKHDIDRPDPSDFKRIVRANPGRVFLIWTHGDDEFFVDEQPLSVADTKGEKGRVYEVENAAGYYICPDDATDPAGYAKGAINQYNQWICGDVWGVCIWEYAKEGDVWELGERDECWGFYGEEYATEELKRDFEDKKGGINENKIS